MFICPLCQSELYRCENFTVIVCGECKRALFIIDKPFPVHLLNPVIESDDLPVEIDVKEFNQGLLKLTHIVYIPFWLDSTSGRIKPIIPYTSQVIEGLNVGELNISKKFEELPDEVEILKQSGPIRGDLRYTDIFLVQVLYEKFQNGLIIHNPHINKYSIIPPEIITSKVDVSGLVIIFILMLVILIASLILPVWIAVILLIVITIITGLWRRSG